MIFGATAVNTRVHLELQLRTRGCGCTGHPAFPTPSLGEGFSKLRAHRAAGVKRMSRGRHSGMSAPRRWHQRPLQPFPSPKVDYRRTIYAPSLPPTKAHPQGTRSHTSHGVERDDCFGGRTSEPRPDCVLRARLGGPCGDAVLLPSPADRIARRGRVWLKLSSSAKADDPVFRSRQRSNRAAAAHWIPRRSLSSGSPKARPGGGV